MGRFLYRRRSSVYCSSSFRLIGRVVIFPHLLPFPITIDSGNTLSCIDACLSTCYNRYDMNDVAAKVTAMEEEIKQLRDMVGKVLTAVEDNKRVVARMVNMILPSDEVTEEELFQEAYQLFGITSESDAD